LSTFPDQLKNRAAQVIASTADLVKNAHQRINVLGSQVSSLAPGAWEDITLSAGWVNTAGYIPAQARILQAGMSQVVGHIQGGTVTDGTVIGTLTSGYYNPVHAHTFTVNSVTGAAASPQAGALSSTAGNLNSGAGTLSDLAADLNSGTATLTDLAGNLTSGTVSGTAFGSLNVANTALTLHSGAVAVPTGVTLHSGAVAVPTALTLTSGVTATPVNRNSPTITLSTSGTLTIANVDPNVTQLSFTQLLPLVTA
jgi:hypothetical protein